MKMNRVSLVVVILLMAVFLCACSPNGGQPEVSTQPSEPVETLNPEDLNVFTRENFPRMDGSTSLVPLGQAIASVLLGESREDVEDLIIFSKTTQSYWNLINNEADIVIAASPPDDTIEELKRRGCFMDIIAADALVFVVNANNPVDSLTTAQVQGIYTGEITNWQELGGNDEEIIAFQRNAASGSQTAMINYVMDGLPLMEPPTEHLIGDMMMLIDAVKNYEDSGGAIGYSVYYYANDMKMAEGLKILAIEGVVPGADTIGDGGYPFIMPYFVAIRMNSSERSPEYVLYRWLLSDEGRRLIESQGYIPTAIGG
jgi:phosphate transport system substrate-binding protein